MRVSRRGAHIASMFALAADSMIVNLRDPLAKAGLAQDQSSGSFELRTRLEVR